MRYWPIILINAVIDTRGICLTLLLLAGIQGVYLATGSWIATLSAVNALGLAFIRLR